MDGGDDFGATKDHGQVGSKRGFLKPVAGLIHYGRLHHS
jgi:hypothetical protein